MVEFTGAERQFYDSLHQKSLKLFEGFIKAGTVSKSWLAIFSLLHRLRQACDHVALTVKSHLDEEEWISNLAQDVPKEEKDEKVSDEQTSKDKDVVDDEVRMPFRNL